MSSSASETGREGLVGQVALQTEGAAASAQKKERVSDAGAPVPEQTIETVKAR